MLRSYICEYACKWSYECNLALIRNDHKKFVGVSKYSWDVRKHSRGLAKIGNMLLKFVRKAYLQHIRKQSLAILIDVKAFIVIVRRFVNSY